MILSGALLALGCTTVAERSTAPRMSWSEAGYDPTVSEGAASPVVEAPRVSPRGGRMTPLGVATLQFVGEVRQARLRHQGRPQPPESLEAWERLDEALAGKGPMTRRDLIRVRLVMEAELGFDVAAHTDVPAAFIGTIRARMQAVAARMRSAPLPDAEPSRFAWPVRPAVITSVFGPRRDPVGGGGWRQHQGVDLGGEEGQTVTASAPGYVVEAALRNGYGLTVVIAHAGGELTRYGHLSELLTTMGSTVERGFPIGLVGRTGHATGPHLHFELWRDGKPQDPLDELGDPEQ